jgi:hypothetical protein
MFSISQYYAQYHEILNNTETRLLNITDRHSIINHLEHDVTFLPNQILPFQNLPYLVVLGQKVME